MHNRCAAIREGGLELHKLLKETNRKLKVSAGLPDWKNYVDFFNSLVRVLSLPKLSVQLVQHLLTTIYAFNVDVVPCSLLRHLQRRHSS